MAESWDLNSAKRTFRTAMLLGLKQMEFLDKLKSVPNLGRTYPSVKQICNHGINFSRPCADCEWEKRHGKDSMAKVSPVLGANGSRNSPVPSPGNGGSDLSR